MSFIYVSEESSPILNMSVGGGTGSPSALANNRIALRTGSVRDRDIINTHAWSGHSYICAHPETERHRLPGQVRSQIDRRVDIASGIATPCHSRPQRTRTIRTTYLPGVASTDKTSPNMRVGDVQKIATAYVRR